MEYFRSKGPVRLSRLARFVEGFHAPSPLDLLRQFSRFLHPSSKVYFWQMLLVLTAGSYCPPFLFLLFFRFLSFLLPSYAFLIALAI